MAESAERFVLAKTPLGCAVEVEVSAGRIVRTRLTDTPQQPTAAISPAAEAVRAALLRHLASGTEDFSELPVDLSAMPVFQRRVLETLHQRVGAGQTVTYGELAVLSGSPGAARAVGTAMSHNPIPLVVPCHRVVPSGGRAFGNYSGWGGVDTKKRLLDLERTE